VNSQTHWHTNSVYRYGLIVPSLEEAPCLGEARDSNLPTHQQHLIHDFERKKASFLNQSAEDANRRYLDCVDLSGGRIEAKRWAIG
jgi:hypothetical protein